LKIKFECLPTEYISTLLSEDCRSPEQIIAVITPWFGVVLHIVTGGGQRYSATFITCIVTENVYTALQIKYN